MPAFSDAKYFKQLDDPAFNVTYTPGTLAPYSGIYRCESCGDEVACNKGQPLPPQNHRQHRNTAVPIRWRLIAVARQAA